MSNSNLLKGSLKTVVDPKYGYRVLEEQPDGEDVHAYFKEDYYKDIEQGEKGLDIQRAMKGDAEADAQRAWMRDTFYTDMADTISRFAKGKRVLEIGCGLGDLLLDLKDRGFAVEGADISTAAVNAARSRGLNVHDGAFETLADTTLKDERYDAIIMVNTLYHLPDPEACLHAVNSLLADDGVLIVTGGNDFNPLQQAVRDTLDTPEYWVVRDHIAYFSYDTLNNLFEGCGFQTVYRQSDFPMEMMALLGFDYTRDRTAGADAHKRRVAFERALPTETRRTLYKAFAQAGLGRCFFMAAQKATL